MIDQSIQKFKFNKLKSKKVSGSPDGGSIREIISNQSEMVLQSSRISQPIKLNLHSLLLKREISNIQI